MHRPVLKMTLGLFLLVSTGVVIAETAAPVVDPRLSGRVEDARVTAQLLATKLRVALKEAMSEKGPAVAISACSELAPNLAQEIALEKGWRVTRVSLKPRNTLLGTPDAWEQQVLLDFEARKKQGADVGELENAEIVKEPQGEYFRYVKAIPTEGACLVCHGASDALAPEIKTHLDKHYPHDRATGFKVGDIRGAVSIKAPLH